LIMENKIGPIAKLKTKPNPIPFNKASIIASK
jgi:hypothetical protein